MKTILCVTIGIIICIQLAAQAQELQQLRLDIEKLAQFKAMLAEMKSGYQSLVSGYNHIINVAKENYDLHDNYLNSLLQVSETVKRDPSILRIHSNQTRMITAYRAMMAKYQSSGLFSINEIVEIGNDFQPILESCSADLDMVTEVIRPGKLRMTDAERLAVLDKVDQSSLSQLTRFNQKQHELDQQLALRKQKAKDLEDIRKISNGH
jgi:hypothetical protein